MIARRTRIGWKTGADYRVICDCQQHRKTNPLLRRAVRIASRGVAVLVSVPLAVTAFTAFDLPIAAMSLKQVSIDSLHSATKVTAPAPRAMQQGQLPVFDTPAMRNQFLTPSVGAVSLDVFKEEYFRTHVPYGAIIYREARKNDLPPELVAAMVQTESDFRPKLVSNKSAQGLMQIVPETARILGIRNPFDPEQNIAAGTRYFRNLLNRFEGNQAIALAAYNAGPTNVARFGGVPPFPETQQYIQKVNRRHTTYRDRVRSSYELAVRMTH